MGCGGRFAPLTEFQQGFEAGEDLCRRTFSELLEQLRQMLSEKGIANNPAVDDQWIIDELRKLLGIENSPHRFLNFP
jgi:hypothetical protein